MTEPSTITPGQESGQTSVPSAKSRGRKTARRVALLATLALLAYILYGLYSVFITPDRRIQQIYLVPKDATFIIQTNEPVNDWKKFSRSEPWLCLKKAASFAEISKNVETLDSVVRNNETLLGLVGKREMIISLHHIRSTAWDFLIVLDLQKVSKVDLLKDQIEQILKLGGNTVTQRTYNGINIVEMRDLRSRDILYTAFVDNHFIASYTSALLEASIDEREKPQIGLDHAFIEAERLVAGKGLCRLYVNYAYVPRFMSIYLGGSNEYIDLFSGSMDFAGLYFDTGKDRMEVKGYTLLKEATDPYISALLNSGSRKMKAHEIMSARTAFYTNIGFDNPATFVKELEKALAAHDAASYAAYTSTGAKLEKYFDISFDQHFLSWMSGEFALSQSEAGLLGYEPEVILAVRANSIGAARENMDLLEKRIRRRTPVKIKTVNYKEYGIHYVEMKGFFRLFFGGLFDKFEKPFYTYIDDYVVFSNQSASLLSFIEDYEQKNLLRDDAGFSRSLSRVSGSSTIFVYADVHKFYPQLQRMLNPSTWADMQANRDVLYSFPQWVFQVVGGRQQASMQFVMDFKPYEPPVVSAEEGAADADDPAMDGEASSDRELMNELKRFYVEKFQGNVLREFYPGGALLSESEVRDGKRNGKHRQYYESGALRLRGKFIDNQPRGTWKYYTEEGKFDRKDKF